VNNMNDDPTRDPQLADAYSALGQLLAAAAWPVNDGELAARVAMRMKRQTRRRRLRIGAAVVAIAASLLLAVGLIVERWHSAEQAVADTTRPPAAIAVVAPATDPAPQLSAEGSSIEISDWDDELSEQSAALAGALESAERRWQEGPDGIARLKSQVEQFELDLTDAAL
jgi:hypothetical protein